MPTFVFERTKGALVQGRFSKYSFTAILMINLSISVWGAESRAQFDKVDSYIVVLKKPPESLNLVELSLDETKLKVQSAMMSLENRFGLRSAKQIFSVALQGGVYQMTQTQARELEKDPEVEFIEKDQIAHINVTQKNATWGLDRIDQVSSRMDGNYNFDYTGAGVNVYVIDTGMRITHREFEEELLTDVILLIMIL
jgi:subtilisin family serine protease